MQYDLFEEDMITTLAREGMETRERLNCLRRKFFAEYEEIKRDMDLLQQRIQNHGKQKSGGLGEKEAATVAV